MTVINFEAAARGRLAARLADSETNRAALATYSAGVTSLGAATDRAALALMKAESLPETVRTVTHVWPRLLGVDMTAVAIASADEGMVSSAYGTSRLPAGRVADWNRAAGRWVTRDADISDLFGVRPRDLGTAYLLPIEMEQDLGFGVVGFADTRCRKGMEDADARVLDFLAAALSRMLAKCLDANI